MASGLPVKEFTTEELDAMAAAELPTDPTIEQPGIAAPVEQRRPAMGPVAQLEAGREYSTAELDLLEKSSTPPPPKEFTTEELDQQAVSLFDDPNYAPTRDEYFELKDLKQRMRAEGKIPGTAELAAKAVGGLFVTAGDAFNSAVFSPIESLAKSSATLQTGVGRAALGAMDSIGWAKELIQGTPKYRNEENGEFFFYNNEVQLQNALDAGQKLRPTTEEDLKDYEFENYLFKKGIDAQYQALGEQTAPTELLTRLLTGRNQQETPDIAQAGVIEMATDPTNLIPFGAGAKTLGLSRLGKTVSSQTAGVIGKVAGGLADGGEAMANRFADVVTNTTGLKPSTAGTVVRTLTRTSVGGGLAAGASALGAPPEVATVIAGFYPAYKAGIGVLRTIETSAGAAKVILRESADATSGLDQAARAAVLANPSVPQVFKEVLERPTNFIPIESTPARLAAEQALSPQMRAVMGKLANPAIVQSVRGASALAKGAVKGAAVNAPFALLAANAGEDEQAAAMLGAGATFGAIGGGVDRFTGLQKRRQQAAISDVSRMLVDVELNGGDVGKLMSTQTPESLVKLASLQGTFRNGLDFVPLNAVDYAKNVEANGGAGSAGLFVQAPAGERAKVYINLDAKRQGIEPHEFGHALLASGALDGQQKFAARAWVDKTYGAEGIKARAEEYATNIARNKAAAAFPGETPAITPSTLATEMDNLSQGGLARGDMDALDWARDEIFAETFAKATETMDFNAIRRGAPAGGNFLTFAEGILGAQARALSASGVRIDPQTGAPLEKPADLFAKNPLLATDSALVKQLTTYTNNYRQWANNPGHEKPAGVRVAPSGRATDIANNPQVTFYDRGDGIKANAFATQDPVTGQAILRDQRDLNAEHAKVREQLRALGGSKLIEPSNPVLGPKKTTDGRVTVRGKVLPPQFDFLNGFMPHIRNFARQFEQFGDTGESMQVRYHAIGTGDSGAFRIKNLGNLEAITREVIPFEWQLTKAGNLNAVVLDLTQFRNRAMRAISNRNEALAPFNWELGQLETDLKQWMDNHRNNLPGETKIGTDKRDAINALVGIATNQNRAKNPLNGSFGPGGAIKQFRLDRVDAAIGTGRQGFHFDYDKANGNRLPEITSPLPDLSRDLPGQAMPDAADADAIGLSSAKFLREAVGDGMENLRQKLAKRQGTGIAKNKFVRFHNAEGKPIYIGAIQKDGGKSFAGWIEETEAWQNPSETTAYRQWYAELKGHFTQIFGPKAGEMMMAWLAAQQNVSPGGALGNVFKVEDRLAGIGTGKKGGLADGKIEGILLRQVPEKGFGQKLTDFVDAGFLREFRTYMGSKPEGGRPFVADVHTGRDSGHVDQQTLTRLADQSQAGNLFIDGQPATIKITETKTVQVGGKSVKVPERIKVSVPGKKSFEVFVDQRGSPGGGQYEGISEWGNAMTDHLNKINWRGGNWTPAEVQAVGWMRVLRQYGLAEPTVLSALQQNTAKIFAEVNYGSGNLIPANFPAFDTLSPDAQRAITSDVLTDTVNEVANLIGGSLRVQKISAATGAWGNFRSPTTAIEVLGSSEATDLLGLALATVSEQAATMSATFGVGGKNSRVLVFKKSDGTKFNDAEMQSIIDDAGISGYTMQHLPGGDAGIIADATKDFKPKGLTEERAGQMTQKLVAWSEKNGIDLNVQDTAARITSYGNDWKTNKDGKSYLSAIVERGGSQRIRDIVRFRRRYAEILQQAFERHATGIVPDAQSTIKPFQAAVDAPSAEVLAMFSP